MNEELAQRVLAHVRRKEYRPVKPRVIAKQLDLDEDAARELKRVIKRLVKRGELAYGPSHLVTVGKTAATPGKSPEADRSLPKNSLTGVFRRTSGGFGFVRPTGTAPSAGRDLDIYIAAEDAGDAASGDLVLVKIFLRRNRFGNTRGEVVRVIERETHRFVGTYFESGGTGYVRVDGTLFARPIWVGDPGAKNASPNDKVVFEMVRFPTHAHDGEGVLIEVLGPSGQPSVDTLSILREYDLPDQFPIDVLDDARQRAEAFQEDEVGDRMDLRDETVITIDPIDARDFDDAISLQRIEHGHWRLGVHIADVSFFVQTDTPLDREARNRATSVYLPDRVIPMLPELISNGLASLQPDKPRYTKTAFIHFTAEGVPIDVELANTIIRSKRRFTYEEVDDFLASPDAWREKLAPDVHRLLSEMHTLAMLLRQRRRRLGALELSLDEVKVDLDRHGRVVGAHKEINTVSHQIIEEFMLAANLAVARKLEDEGVPFLRRVHPAPDPRKMKALTEFVRSLGIPADNLEDRFELQRVLDEVAERPEHHAVHFAALRSLQQAIYSPDEEGHYALASDCYCHFTSPIRRYPDLTIHRLIDVLLAKGKPTQHYDELQVLGEHCSQRERRAEQAERELTKIKLLRYLSERIGETMHGIVTGVESFGLFVQGLEIPAEGLVHISSLSDDLYQYDARSHTLSGRRAGNVYRLGDKVEVVIALVDHHRRELDFRLVSGGRREAPEREFDSHRQRGKRRRR